MSYLLNVAQPYHRSALAVPFSPAGKHSSDGDAEHRMIPQVEHIEGRRPCKNMSGTGHTAKPDLIFLKNGAFDPCGEVKKKTKDKRIRFGQDADLVNSVKDMLMDRYRLDMSMSNRDLRKLMSAGISLEMLKATFYSEKKFDNWQDEYFDKFFKEVRYMFIAAQDLWMPISYKTRDKGLIRVCELERDNNVRVALAPELYKQFEPKKKSG